MFSGLYLGRFYENSIPNIRCYPMPVHHSNPGTTSRSFPLTLFLRYLSGMKYPARMICLFAVICACISPLKTRAQAYPNPYVDLYVFFENNGNYGGAVHIGDADQVTHSLGYLGSIGNHYIYKGSNMMYPMANFLWLGAGVEYYGLRVEAQDVAGARNLFYPITESVVNNVNFIRDIPLYNCTPQFPTGQGPTFQARFAIPMLTPAPIISSALNRTICANESVLFDVVGSVVPPSDKYVKTSVEWECSLNGAPFKALGTSAFAYWTFTPLQQIPELRTGKQTVRFHYRHKVEYPSTTLYSPYSPDSDPVEILPAPPTLRNRNVVDSTASCKGMETGSIRIAGSDIISGFPRMRWLLRRGNVSTPCDPDSPTGCGNLDKWSPGNVPVSGGIDIRGLAADTYSLWIINEGEDAGSCYTPYTIVVPELAPLRTDENIDQHKNVSCYNGNDGTIEVVATGADPDGAYTFTLLYDSQVIGDNQPGTGRIKRWNNLRAGTYKVQVKNSTCNTEVAATADIIVSQPPLLSAYLVATSPLCASPGDGSIDIQASATGGTVASYTFNLYRNGAPFQTSGAVTADRYTFTDLPGGVYKAEVTNSDANCPGWDSTVTLSTLIPLSIDITPVDSISCYGGNDGNLVCTATGGSGLYEYTVSKDNLPLTTNTTGTFSGLTAGNYTVAVKNQGNTCDDRATKNIVVFQRAPLEVSLEQTPISCYGETDALIKAVVKGGSGSYRYNWQELKNGVWTNNTRWFSTDTQIEDLTAGTFRVIITDDKALGCSVTSAESIVQIATEVKIAGITVHDAVCLADGAHIDMSGTGGTGVYLYEWCLNGSQTYVPFTDTTGIHTAGTYRLRLSDGHGCTVNAPATYDITLPSATVSFTYTLSDYAGHNISCKGNDNGFAQITATGGNGGNYNGYMYALDNNPYTTDPLVEHITAGTHYLHVKDGRGCIVTRQITMTEPAAVLGLTVTSKAHDGCGADPIGNITVAPEGGTSPYTYAIDAQPWQNDPIFSNLIANDYNLRIKDAAGCITDITTTLTSRYPSLSATADITAVNCYGESNGALRIQVRGGDGNYSYQWNTPVITGNGAENLIAGDYAVTITDSKGCKQVLTYTVSQPQRLQLQITAPPVCDGLSDGTIASLVTGGTTPYQYSLDHSSWLPAGAFSGLAAGNYHIAVQDAHNCAVDQDITIAKANVKPDINFLVASRKNAFDTLVIKEINIPAPDEVNWSYHPAAVLLGNENSSPLIRFTDPGNYWVEMAATFGSCTYTLRKELAIGAYDPDAGPGYVMPVHVIDTVTLSPNPNNGNFNFRIKLNRKQQIIAYVYDMNGVIAGKKQYAPTLQLDDSFTVGGTATGTFILRVITESESRDVRFIISR